MSEKGEDSTQASARCTGLCVKKRVSCWEVPKQEFFCLHSERAESVKIGYRYKLVLRKLVWPGTAPAFLLSEVKDKMASLSQPANHIWLNWQLILTSARVIG